MNKDSNINGICVQMMYGIELSEEIYNRHFLFLGYEYDTVTNFENDDLSMISTEISQDMGISLELTKESGKLFLGVYFDAKKGFPLTDIEILGLSSNLEKRQIMDNNFIDFFEKDENKRAKLDRFLFYRKI
jgi:hypothetical protein